MRAEHPTPNGGWIECRAQLPRDGEVVDTMINDDAGLRNRQPLKRQRNLWFFADGSMYVYYTPTHWRPQAQGGLGI